MLFELPIQRPIQINPSHVSLIGASLGIVLEPEEFTLIQAGPLTNILETFGAFTLGTECAVNV
jgi:hypothetical protein